MTKKKVIGIDLGTGFSAVATIENNQPVIIANAEGNRTTPSVVQIIGDEIKVGGAAKRSMVTKPKNTIQLVKRLMGSAWTDDGVQHLKSVSTFDIINKNNKPYIKIDDKEYSPEQISSMIVGEMKKTAEDYLGETVTDAVITCPAWFNDVQRNATKTAGELAGLNVLRIINEPTAAILASTLATDGKDKKVAVVDSGCGTVDVSVCDVSDGMVEVLASDGDIWLGGSNYDQVLAEYIVNEFKKDNAGIDLSKDQLAWPRIIEAAEKAKCELSSSTSTDITLPYITVRDNQPLNLVMTISRAKFEQLIKDLNERTVEKALSAIKKAGLTVSDIDTVLLVGGTTRIPSLQELISNKICKNLSQSVNPDEAVAIGAAKQADVLAGNSEGDVLLLDVTPLSLGIETIGGVMTRLVDANTTVPCQKKKVFSTAEDNQPAVTIHVLQGERPMATDNKSIGMFTLDGIMPARRGVPQIEVTFDIDANGIVSVSAKDLATNKEQKIKIENNNLTDEEIEAIKADAEKFKEADEKKQEEMKTINEAEQFAFSIESVMTDEKSKELAEKITEDEKSKLTELCTKVHDAVKSSDIEKVKSSKKELEDNWTPIVTKLYQEQQSTQQSGAQSTTGSENPFEDIMSQAKQV